MTHHVFGVSHETIRSSVHRKTMEPLFTLWLTQKPAHVFALDEVRARGWTENADRLAEMNATRLGVDNSLYLALHTGPLAETR